MEHMQAAQTAAYDRLKTLINLMKEEIPKDGEKLLDIVNEMEEIVSAGKIPKRLATRPKTAVNDIYAPPSTRVKVSRDTAANVVKREEKPPVKLSIKPKTDQPKPKSEKTEVPIVNSNKSKLPLLLGDERTPDPHTSTNIKDLFKHAPQSNVSTTIRKANVEQTPQSTKLFKYHDMYFSETGDMYQKTSEGFRKTGCLDLNSVIVDGKSVHEFPVKQVHAGDGDTLIHRGNSYHKISLADKYECGFMIGPTK